MVARHIPGAFYRVLTFEEVWGYSSYMGSGSKPPVAKNGFRAFHRAYF